MARRPAAPPARTVLGPGDWVRAALAALQRGGPVAVAVEPLARQLGVTKGSFYWHFQDRTHLLEAALAAWEQDMGRDLALRFEGIRDPKRRLRVLLFAAFEDRDNGLLFAALTASGDDPRVGPVLRRVSESRMALATTSLRALGFGPEEARRRAVALYSAYAGYFSLLRAAPEAVAEVGDLSTYVKTLADALLPPGPPRRRRE